MKNKNALFITDKWCAGNPTLGFANHFDNLFNTFSESVFNYKTHTLHFDESFLIYGKHIDDVLIDYCNKFKIDIVFFAFGGGEKLAPSLSKLKELKNLGFPSCFIWYDCNPNDLVLKNKLEGIIDLNVFLSFPTSEFHDKMVRNSNDLFLWTPESKSHFYPDFQIIPISFIGSLRYPYRNEYIGKLIKIFPKLVVSGGQRENSLTFPVYSRLVRQSKMGINFSKNIEGEGYYQVKGRVFEIISSKSLLLEEKNNGTSHFFKPNEEFIEFENFDDLVDKINFYSENGNERLKIAENGYKKFQEKYTPKIFWNTILDFFNKVKVK
jgi:glycosyltransferase involved in cell wall biosynthesis